MLFTICLAASCVALLPGRAFATDEHRVVVSLGDSYSSGEGVEPFYHQNDAHDENNLDWLAHRSEKSWGGKLRIQDKNGDYITLSDVRDGGDTVDWYFVAASGAETQDIKNRRQPKPVPYWTHSEFTVSMRLTHNYSLPEQIKVFDSIPYGTVDYVTMTLSGNDAGFVDILTTAVAKSFEAINPDKLANELNKIWDRYDSEIGPHLEQAYRDIREAAGSQATIIVAGYPQLLAQRDINEAAINVYEAKLINENVSKFNGKINELVTRLREQEGFKIYFVSVEERFKGHGAYSDDPYLNPVILGAQAQDLDDWAIVSSYSVHPNEKGVAAYARAVQYEIDRQEDKKNGITRTLPENSGATDGKTRDIALVLDVSGSMAGDPIEEVQRATVRFGDAVLGSTAKVGIIAFDNNARVVEGLSNNTERIEMASEQLSPGGGTNLGAGLMKAHDMLEDSDADRKIIVIMTDGASNAGMSDNELLVYSSMLTNTGYYVYTLGFFSNMTSDQKANPQWLLESIASPGCHYEVSDASDLQFFFGDIADQINGVKYNYIRIACPVDVTVEHDGEVLSSVGATGSMRSSFGTLTFEVPQTAGGGKGSVNDEDTVKILRLREGPDYKVSINGTGTGTMDYSIGFVDDEGEYSDMRYFDGIEVSPQTQIATTASVSDSTLLTVDYDGDGVAEKRLVAGANEHAKLVDNSDYAWRGLTYLGAVLVLFAALHVWNKVRRYRKEKRAQQ